MKYKHDLAIKHMPKFIFGTFLVVVCSIATVGGLYTLLFTNDHNFGTLLMTMINAGGTTMGATLFIPDSIVYTATEIPDEELSAADQLKKDLKG